MKTSALEQKFWIVLNSVEGSAIPRPVREYVFAPPRRFRFDFCWLNYKVAAEMEGGIWSHGAHNRPMHFTSDCDKYNLAAVLGWRVLRFTTEHFKRDYKEIIDTVKGTLCLTA